MNSDKFGKVVNLRKFKFKMSKRRNYRKKITTEDEDEDNNIELLEERKELQKFRQRAKGINVEDLTVGNKLEAGGKSKRDDPFKINSGGGLTEMDTTKKTVTDLSKFGTEFSSETNQRDEDLQLLKYIEEEMQKKKGVNVDDMEKKDLTKEDLLFQLPDAINVKSAIKSEEMLSSQMLSGIPEVDLGIDAKIKNIEATEEAKMKMIEENKNRKDRSSEFVPTNMASNFMHHSRFFDEKKALESEKKKEQAKKREESKVIIDKGPTVGGEIIENNSDTNFVKKAMSSTGGIKKRDKRNTDDDYMFEKFKKRSKEGGRY